MADDEWRSNVLKSIKTETLPEHTNVYRTTEGTTYYLYFADHSKHRLYVKWEGREIDAQLPGGHIHHSGVYGNALYIACNGKVFKSVFTQSDGITVSYVRDLNSTVPKNEIIVGHHELTGVPICHRVREGKRYVYRLHEDPSRDGMHFDLSRQYTRMMLSIHRGNHLVYSIDEKKTYPTLRKLGNNLIGVEVSRDSFRLVSISANDDSPFIYLTMNNNYVFTFNNISLKYLPPFQIEGVTNISNVTVSRGGEITVRGKKDGDFQFVTAQLPIIYYEIKTTIPAQIIMDEHKIERIEELTVLKVATKEPIPVDTFLYRTADGITYYHVLNSPESLYTKWEGKSIYAKLPDRRIDYIGAHGEFIYFICARQVYKAVFTKSSIGSPDRIKVSHIRDLTKDERIHKNANEHEVPLCFQVIEGTTCVYRACVNPVLDRICVDLSEEEREMIKCIHRGNVYLFSEVHNHTNPSVRKLRGNVFVVEVSQDRNYEVSMFAINESPFIHLSLYNKYISTFDTTTMEFRPPLRIESFEKIWKFAVSRNGEIGLSVWMGNWYFVTVQLPKEYADIRTTVPTELVIEEKEQVEERETVESSRIQYDPMDLLGEGSQGKVFRGFFKESSFCQRVAAVKLMYNCEDAEREILHLVNMKPHPNVIKYFGTVEKKTYILIALQLCTATLEQYFENEDIVGKIRKISSKDIIRQITQGIQHLHSENIVHRDLKPQNVLIYVEGKIATMVISDFGIAKKIDPDNIALTSGKRGTEGWRAPEKGTRTLKSDIFNLGCLFFYVLTKGKFHPYGEPDDQRHNISKGEIVNITKLEGTEECSLSTHLINNALDHTPLKRPSVAAFLNHPVFWKGRKRFDFFDKARKECFKNMPANLEDPTVVHNDWITAIQKEISRSDIRMKKIQVTSVYQLLKTIRHTAAHFEEKKNLHTTLGNGTDDVQYDKYIDYFTNKFPELLLHVYKVFKKAKGFERYYGEWNSIIEDSF